MNQELKATLTRKQIRDIFRAHKGSVMQLSRELGLSHTGISLWLKGRATSATIAPAAHKMALELQSEAEKDKAVA